MRLVQDITRSVIPLGIPSSFFRNFRVTIDRFDTLVTSSGSTSEIVTDDIVMIRDTDATYRDEGRVIIKGVLGATFTSLDPDVATVDGEGYITYVSEGTARINVTAAGVTRQLTFSTQEYGGGTVDTLDRWVSGSLGEHIAQQIDSRLVGQVKSSNMPLFSSQNHITDTFVRNPDCWVTRSDGFVPVDVTSISPSNSRDNNRRAGTLITPRHVLNTAHYPLYNGDKIYFVTQDGSDTVIERTIIGSVNHPEYSPYFPDLRLYTLDSDLPATISPCKTLPQDFTDYLVNTSLGKPPTLGLDQEERGLVTDLYTLNSSVPHTTPTEAQRLAFYEDKIGGDSGNPSFLIINNELVLLTCWTYGGAGSGTSVPYYQSDINTMIQTADAQAGVSTGYTLGTVDLSGFPSYA